MALLFAPKLVRSPLLAAAQLVAWLFFQPTSWQRYCQTISPPLIPLFPLSALQTAQLQQPALRRLLWLGYGVWPLLLGGSITILLISSGTPLPRALALVAFGMSFGLIVGVVLSAAAGIAALTAALIMSAAIWRSSNVLLVDMIIGTGYTWIYGIAGAVATHVMQNLSTAADATPRRSRAIVLRQFGGLVAALLITVVATVLVILGTNWLVAKRNIGGVGDGAVSLLFVGIPALLIGVATIWHVGSWRTGLRVALLTFWGATLAFGNTGMQLGVDIPAQRFFMVFALMTALIYLVLFTLSFVLIEQLTGPWAAAAAASIGGIALIPILNGLFRIYAFQTNLLLAIGLAIAGITMQWWRPLLTYPFQTALQAILLQRAEQDQPWPLAVHPALWDELQYLPLYGFDDLLVTLIEQEKIEPIAILTAIGQSRQAWAAQGTQIELEARHLARCTSISAISAMGNITETVEIIGPGSTLLRALYVAARDVHAATLQQSRYNQQLVLQSVDERLGSLFREVSRSSEFYARRFSPIIRQWQTLVVSEIERLTYLTVRIGEIINPYVVGVPLTRKQEIFVGRAEISRQIELLLRDSTHPPLLLYGQRRMGKTSLLYNLRWMLPHSILPLFVDLQGPVAWSADHAGFLYNIAKAMSTSAAEQEVFFPTLERKQLEHDPFSNFDDWLDLIQRQLAGHGRKTILLTFDEFEALAEGFRFGYLHEQAVLGTLRHLIQHRANLKILLAGSHQLQEFPSWSSYLINAQTLHLSYLHPSEAQQLIESPVAGFPLIYEPDIVEHIIHLTHGHPYLVQLLCSEVVTLKNSQPTSQRYHTTGEEITQVVPTLFKTGRQFFVDIERNQVGQDTVEYLIDLAQHDEIFIVGPSLVDKFKDPEKMSRILAQLQQRELITKRGHGYAFQIPLIRQWFAARARE